MLVSVHVCTMVISHSYAVVTGKFQKSLSMEENKQGCRLQ